MNKPIIHIDLDGCVADFVKGYKEAFGRDAYADDSFTVNQFCLQVPDFFKLLPVLEKGKELVGLLNDYYKVVFLTTPMAGMETCKRDKIDWVKNNIGEFDIIFSDNKADYVVDETSILIDDMDYNLQPWADAGGTAINIRKSNDEIIDIIEKALYNEEEFEDVQEQLNEMEVDVMPTEAQKETGNYKKGKIKFKKLNIVIENPKGSWRFGFDENGKKWLSKLKCHYGYISDSLDGADGDKIDCFIGNRLNRSLAFVVNQMTADNRFDEHKIVLGCKDFDEARELYLANYKKGWESRIGSIVQTNTKQLRNWIKTGNTHEPYVGNK